MTVILKELGNLPSEVTHQAVNAIRSYYGLDAEFSHEGWYSIVVNEEVDAELVKEIIGFVYGIFYANGGHDPRPD